MVELKQISAYGFETSMTDLTTWLPQHFRKVQTRHPDIQGLLLLASKVDHDGQGNWLEPKLVGKMWTASYGELQDVSHAGIKAAKGQKSVVKKMALPQVWSEMEWHELADGTEVGLFSQFLRKLGIECRHPEEKAATYNQILMDKGVAGRIEQKAIRNRAGKTPWVATKSVFRKVYQHL